MTEMTIRIPRRAVTLIAASGLALGGAAALATGWTASATQGKDTVHKVWVCKYVQKPGVNEVLKGGKNPISVDWHSLTGKTPPQVGDTFSDAQFKSVVVKIGGTSPGVKACGAVTPPKTTKPPTTPPTSKPPTTPPTSKPPTTPPTSKPPTTTAPHETPNVIVTTTTTPAGGGGAAGGVSGGAGGVTAVTPGAGAPQTGGDGESSPANRLLGAGLLASGLALGAGEAVRRRRENATR